MTRRKVKKVMEIKVKIEQNDQKLQVVTVLMLLESNRKQALVLTQLSCIYLCDTEHT